ncbi:MAG: hypothetical protein JW942_01420 [Opitutales bacterium]|nr:hypothetical protein [Opitutales bacterium]
MSMFSRSTHSPISQGVRFSRRRHGFTYIELILASMLGAMVIGSAAFMFASLAGAFDERPTGEVVSWSTDPVRRLNFAPAYSQLSYAVQLQNTLMEALEASHVGPTNDGASCVFVLGGRNLHGVGADATDIPSHLTAPSTLPWLTAMHPSRMNSSAQFYDKLKELGTAMSTANIEDFSVYVVSGSNKVPLVIHSRRRDVADGGYAIYTVTAFVNGVLNQDLSYEFALETAVADAAEVKPGAIHYWLRQDAAWGLSDCVGAQVVFPDPTAYPYEAASGDSANTYSRFVMFLPTKL